MVEDAVVWKALADETRRGILDRLKQRPATTGELCEEFDHLDRCTVMKHLAVLEHSSLITLRREGRNRLNFLNPVQLQRIHTRWLTSYTAQSAQRLLNLKEEAEKVAPAMPLDNITTLETRAIKYAFEVDIEASREKVWELLTTQIATWWPAHFHSSEATKQFVVEPRVGGRIYEDFGDGRGVLWATVVHLDPPNRLQFRGDLFPDYGGPGGYHLSCELEVKGEGTKLKVADAQYGYITDEHAQSMKDGWVELFGTHLKEKAETYS